MKEAKELMNWWEVQRNRSQFRYWCWRFFHPRNIPVSNKSHHHRQK